MTCHLGNSLHGPRLLKMPDLNCDSLDSAVRTVAGTARSMGLDVVG